MTAPSWTPEEHARERMDAMLIASGWAIQDYQSLNLGAACGVAIRAEDVVHIVRVVFACGNEFAKKITYKAWNPETKRQEKSEHLIQEFRTSPQLRIAVTVDPVATGSDIKPLECLLFLRDVRSRVYFEQMKERGTRVLSPTDLQAVGGADARAKTHFVIVDAVGVCESDKTDSRPLEKKPSVALDALLLGVALGKRDEETLTTLAGRLARLERALPEPARQEVKKLTGGQSLGQLSSGLLRALDPDVIAERATGNPAPRRRKSTPRSSRKRSSSLRWRCAPFDKPEVRDGLLKLRQQSEQTIYHVTIDQMLSQQFDAAAKERAESLIQTFREYIEQHRAKIEALQILYSRLFQQRLTEEGLKELEAKLMQEPSFGSEPVPKLAHAFSQISPPSATASRAPLRRFTDLVSFVRFALAREPVLEPFEEHVRQRFTVWLEEKRAAAVTGRYQALRPSKRNPSPAIRRP